MRQLNLGGLSAALIVLSIAFAMAGPALGQPRRDGDRRGPYYHEPRRGPPTTHRRWPEADYRRRYPHQYYHYSQPPHVVYSPPVFYQPPPPAVIYPQYSQPGISFYIPLDIY